MTLRARHFSIEDVIHHEVHIVGVMPRHFRSLHAPPPETGLWVLRKGGIGVLTQYNL